MTKHSESENRKSREASIRPVSRAAEQLDRTSGELLRAMEEQMEAIKSSDVERMNRLTETYMTMIARFKQEEDRLTEELRKLIDPAGSAVDPAAGSGKNPTEGGAESPSAGDSAKQAAKDPSEIPGTPLAGNGIAGTGTAGDSAGIPSAATPVSMTGLKHKFPESEAVIDHWREMLSEGGKKLMQKHNQLVSLLEFAVKQNGRLMEAVYQAGNRNNSRYGPDGESAVNPGSAINHKI